MSVGVYAATKAVAFRDRIQAIRDGKQIAPVHMHLVLSDLCSLACPGCSYRMDGNISNQRFKVVGQDGSVNMNPNRMLGTDLVKTILREFSEMGGKAVEATGGGEPTLHPDCDELLSFALDLGLDVALVTHGLHLQQKIRPATVARLSWLRISIDAATAETYGKVRPSLGLPHGENIEKALGAVSWARRIIDAAQSKCVLGTGFVVQPENWMEILDAARRYRDAGAHNVRISGLFTPKGDALFDHIYEQARALEVQAVRELGGTGNWPRFTVFDRFGEKIEDMNAPPDYRTCHYMGFTTYMAGNGNLYTCCVNAYNDLGFIGNVGAAGSFREVWESKAKQSRFSTFDARDCSQCRFNRDNRVIDGLVKLGVPLNAEAPPHANFI